LISGGTAGATRPPGEVAGAPIGVQGYAAQALAPMPVRALHRQTIPPPIVHSCDLNNANAAGT
jgi:hypothetical protein